MKKNKTPVSDSIELPSGEETTYDLDGRRYVVTSLFKETDTTTFGDILMRLIQSEVIDNFKL